MINIKHPPKFLVFRYAHGAAGKFLLSLFTLHQKVAHPDETVQKNKTKSTHWPWFQSSFQSELKFWLEHEPNPNRVWNFYFVSNTYERGNHYSNEEFLQECKNHATDFFWQCTDQQLLIPVTWHKQFVPDYYKNSHFVTVIIDEDSKKWFHRALWYKHFDYQNNELIFKQHNVSKYSNESRAFYKQFKNKTSEQGHFIGLAKKYILKSRWIEEFGSQEQFDQPGISQVFLNLSELLDENKCCAMVDRVCDHIGIERLDHSVVKQYQKHWKSCHGFKYS